MDAIVSDHQAVDAVFGELQGKQGGAEHRRALADHVIAELVRHSVAEEQYVYPAIRRALGDEAADHEIAEHAEAEEVMQSLDGVDATDPKFDALVEQLITDIRHHVHEEETDVLPRLITACSAEELEQVATDFEKAKKTAPTRPHPGAPDRPPANKLLAPGAGMVDRLKDMLTGRQT